MTRATAPSLLRELRVWLAAALLVAAVALVLGPGQAVADGSRPAPQGERQASGCFQSCRIEGTRGGDVLIGTPGPDVIVGGPGNDRIAGLGGNDTLAGEAGNDVISGAGGDDGLLGGDGHDVLGGGRGEDFLQGNRGRDSLAGGSGRDLVDLFDRVQGNDEGSGGSGVDNCFADPRDLLASCEQRTVTG